MIIDSPIISGSNAASGSFNQFGNINVTGSLTVSSSTFTANNNVVLGTNSSNTVVVNSTIDSDIVPYEGGTRNLGSNSTKWDNVYSNAFTGSLFGTSSFALTASYATNAGAGAGFPFSGSAQITGSLLITELSGSGVRYLTTDDTGLIIAQTASAAIKTTQAVTSTAGQTSFNINNGYTTGLVDVFINGTKLSATEFTDTSGTVITLATGSNDGDTVEFVKYFPASGVTNNALRQLTTFTASAGQTVFSASYTPGLLDIYYNGARLSTSDYTANNGTYFTLATASVANDVLDVLVYSYQVGAFSGIGGQGVTSQIAYFNTTSSITGSNNFTISGSTMTVTGSLLVSGSGTFTNIGPAVMSGSLNVSGAIVTNSTITAQTLVVQTITSSVSVMTGSTNFGTSLSNTHIFSGSVTMNPGGLFVSSSGNVGIGTATPTSSLHIYSAATSGSQSQLVISNPTSNTNDAAGIRFNANAGGSQWDVKFQTVRGIDWFQMTNDAGTSVKHSWNDTKYYPGASSLGANRAGYISGNGTQVGIGITPDRPALLQIGDAGIANTNTYFGTGQVRIGGGSEHGSNTVLSVAPGVVAFDRPGVVGGAFTINSSGHVLTPSQPAFYAWVQSSTTTTTGNYAGFTSTRLNRGSHYNTSTGRFTAPTAGVYRFLFAALYRQQTGTSSGEISISVNGSNINSRGLAYANVAVTNAHIPCITELIISLNANDYVMPFIYSVGASSDWYMGDNLAYFCGYLIG